ncbi:cation:proton antiporter [Nonomuraea jiangxiensis]|uniref:Kef-type K+ transport system, membrane component KefB n=1 Tax=Nonomuraea jiangxiensis TaxID=633440 RepID=A0A1G8IIC5_9ACTN|nr:cation:proton antiporter [Nonomuraea jiangxiensis]SDI18547.1 Kef-type K+ transport system, membrane component KefB [Nonomuraea jiangxiensis]
MHAPVAPIPAHSLLVFLLQLGLLLLLAHVFGRVAARLGMAAVVGELFVGVVLGPSFLAHVAPGVHAWLFPADPAQFHLLDAVGQVGVLLLVGLTGIYMNMGLIRRFGRNAAGISIGGLVVPLGFGIGLGYLLPSALIPTGVNPTVFALFMGVAMCVSAIPVIAKALLDLRMLHRDIGQLTLTAGVIDDAFGWFMLSIVSALGIGVVTAGTVLSSLAHLLLVVIIAFTVGRLIVSGALRLAAKSSEAGPTVAIAIALILLSAAGTHALGLEAVLGAFVCGVLIGSAGRVNPARMLSLRTVVLSGVAPIFFASAGLRMDLTSLADPPVLLAGLAVLAIAILGKFLGVYAGAKLSGHTSWEALALGAGLNARGVIEIVVAMVGLRLGILTVEAYTIVVLVAIVTSLMAPPILRVAMARVKPTTEEKARESEYASEAAF